MSTETRLKPCPFCGGAAKEFERFNANVIICWRCGVKVRQSEMGEGDAAERWNRRATPVAAQPDVTQQTLDDVMAGIPARDAEIEALRKEIEALQAVQVQPYSLDLDPAGIRALTADAISGALALGFQGVNPPPNNEHWLAPFWEIGRESAAQAQPEPDWRLIKKGDQRIINGQVMTCTDPEIGRWQGGGPQQPVSGADQFRDAAQMIELSGNSGELPELTIQWHDTPEAVHRIFWEKAALENGMTYEELIEGAMVGETEHREKFELTYEQEIQAIRDQKCWGCADTETNQIHVWAAPDVDRTLLIHMLAHEIGHLTGEPHTDDIQEELRAETFGKVAAMAYQMLQAQQDADKVDAERWRTFIDNYDEYGTVGFIDGSALKAVIDAARKERA